MRMICCLVGLMSATSLSAQTFEAGRTELSTGVLDGDSGSVSSFRLTGAGSWDLGALGLQIDGSFDQLDPEDGVVTGRAILTADMPIPLRLGISVALTADDGVQADTTTLGLHALYLTDDLRLDGALQFPDHISETGAFSFSISGEQWVTDRLMITTDLYRLSLDDEVEDFYSIGLGAGYRATDRVMLIGEAYQTAADTDAYRDWLYRLGLSYDVRPGLAVTGFYTRRMDDTGTDADGLSVEARFDFGPQGDTARMFQSGPNADRFRIGAF